MTLSGQNSSFPLLVYFRARGTLDHLRVKPVEQSSNLLRGEVNRGDLVGVYHAALVHRQNSRWQDGSSHGRWQRRRFYSRRTFNDLGVQSVYVSTMNVSHEMSGGTIVDSARPDRRD